MTVSNIEVILQEGHEETIYVTPAPGYDAVIKYNDSKFYLHESFEGDIFSINPDHPGNNNSSFIIKAKQAKSNKSTETIKLDVEMIPEDRWPLKKNLTRSSRVTITIEVISALNSN